MSGPLAWAIAIGAGLAVFAVFFTVVLGLILANRKAPRRDDEGPPAGPQAS